jgi:hypothetical protein
VSSFQQAKFWLVHHVDLAKDALHIYVALILFFGSMLLFRWRVGDARPWLVVLAAALLGEAWDLRDRLANGVGMDWAGHWKDIWNTLFWPSAILLLGRFTNVFRRRGR